MIDCVEECSAEVLCAECQAEWDFAESFAIADVESEI